ncbi:hypothetical protein BG452_04350 [Streptomyces sp. CBMA123]|nr:hypothetical protein [Streptomyces sp. CBMA123]
MELPSPDPEVVYAWWRDPVLVVLEEILTVLEQAHPVGLESIARTFRAFDDPSWDGMEKFLQHRAELVVAALLAESGVPFRFNTTAGPDLLLDGAPTCAIEVSSRSPKSLFNLNQVLGEGLRARGFPDTLTITAEPIPPVEIRSQVRDAIVQQFLPPDGSPGVGRLRAMAAPSRPDDGIPASWVTVTRGGSGITSYSAPYDSPHMTALAQSVATNVLRDKRKIRQSQALPTLLVVDVSRTDLPDLRCWEKTFERIWKPHDAFLGLAALVADPNQRTPTLTFSINPYADPEHVAHLASGVSGCPAFGVLQDLI